MKINGYTILQVITETKGMKTAVATQESLDRKVFLKILTKDFSSHEDILIQFESEAKALAKLDDPNIVTVYEFVRIGETPFIVLEYFPGDDLHSALQEQGPFSEEELFRVMEQCLKAVSGAHTAGILHRDIKPENVLMNDNGLVKITDFGMASLKGSSDAELFSGGTPGYLAPELALGETPSEQTDIFALGMTFYELASGVNPLHEDDLNKALNLAVSHIPDKLSSLREELSHHLVRIIERMIAKSPDERYKNCEGALSDLKEIGIGTPKEPEAPVVRQKTTTPISNLKQKRWLRAVPFAILLAVIIGYWWLSSYQDEGVVPTTESQQLDEDIPPSEVVDEDKYTEEVQPPTFEAEQQDAVQVAAVNETQASEVPQSLEGVTANINVGEPKSSILIMANPWAEISIDNKIIGTTPFKTPVTLAAGDHEVLFRNPDYPEYSRSFTLQDSGIDTLYFRWEDVFGYVELSAHPWAKIWIDGKYIDVTPLEGNLALSAGEHHLLLKNPDFPVWQKYFNVTAGDTVHFKVQL